MLRGVFGSGGGAAVGGTGTTNTIPRWTGASTLGDSGLIDNGTAIYTTTRTVGIGTATPASALHVRNNTSGITLDSTLGSGRQYQLNQLRTGVSNAGFEIRDVTAGAAVISIDASQNVGIGTASPNAILSVYNAGTPTISLWNSSNYSRLATNTNDLYIDAGLGGAAGAVIFRRGSGTVDSARIDSNGNIYGTSGTTGMTNGFFYIPAAAGAPTGVPTAVAGRVPMYYDTTNNQFYVYNGAWKKVTLA